LACAIRSGDLAFNAVLILKESKTLPLRSKSMRERQGGRRVAVTHPAVAAVNYAGLSAENHPTSRVNTAKGRGACSTSA